MSLPTPNWTLNEDHIVYVDGKDAKNLPEGSFARPLAIEYVPSHVKDRSSHKHFDSEKEVYAYTSLGIVPIPLRKLSKV